ncbi:class I SAM-dependent methyltransferase [Kiritimatiellaeota bacterium B1221]|nr:class I SAM-dependent methyltransferase [Kiritimatiellaeota bacterium B1221]
MKMSLKHKSTNEEIRIRFDNDVERFSNMETGQAATIDAPLAMELITQAAIAATPVINRCLDIGCGAGNNTIKLLRESSGDFDCDICDLSEPMLRRAEERITSETSGAIRKFHGDIRELPLPEEGYDVILAAAVLHHLREESDWESTFRKLYTLLRPGGSIWITDLVTHENEKVHALMWQRYADYLISQGGKEYQEKVFTYIEQEDSPRSVTFQLELLKKVGFQKTEILHKNSCFAAFGAIKGEQAREAPANAAPHFDVG